MGAGGALQFNIRAAIVISSPGKLDIYTGRNNKDVVFLSTMESINALMDGRRWVLIRSISSIHMFNQPFIKLLIELLEQNTLEKAKAYQGFNGPLILLILYPSMTWC